jgi:hypothetical protein
MTITFDVHMILSFLKIMLYILAFIPYLKEKKIGLCNCHSAFLCVSGSPHFNF